MIHVTHQAECYANEPFTIDRPGLCICDRLRAAYRRGYNDHARSQQHWQDTHGAYRVVPLPPEQNARILRALENVDTRWNQHGEGENP